MTANRVLCALLKRLPANKVESVVGIKRATTCCNIGQVAVIECNRAENMVHIEIEQWNSWCWLEHMEEQKKKKEKKHNQ